MLLLQFISRFDKRSRAVEKNYFILPRRHAWSPLSGAVILVGAKRFFRIHPSSPSPRPRARAIRHDLRYESRRSNKTRWRVAKSVNDTPAKQTSCGFDRADFQSSSRAGRLSSARTRPAALPLRRPAQPSRRRLQPSRASASMHPTDTISRVDGAISAPLQRR